MTAIITAPTAAAMRDHDRSDDGLGDLVGRAVQGDRSAMRAFLLAVAPVIVRAARRVLGRSHPDVEDVAQQALVALVGQLAQFRAESSVIYFAERIAVYRALTARRDAGVRRRLAADVPADEMESGRDGPSPLNDLAERTRRTLLLKALDTLPPPQAEALTLHFLFDHTIAEIAGMVGVPEETVRSRLRHGKQALRTKIEKDQRLGALREIWT